MKNSYEYLKDLIKTPSTRRFDGNFPAEFELDYFKGGHEFDFYPALDWFIKWL